MKLVGVTGTHIALNPDEKTPFIAARSSYFTMLESVGAAGLLIHNTTNKAVLDTYADELSALLLTGGGDIHPKFYNKEKEALTGAYNMTLNELRDETELYLVKEFLKRKKPILGICRGMQLINVAFRGTLIQDIKTAIPQLTEKHLIPPEDGMWYIPAHDVIIEPNTRLFKNIEEKRFTVNSVHHQMVDKIGDKLRIAARSPEGVNEALEYEGKSFVLGVQWHPEKLLDTNATKQILEHFIKSI